MEKIKRRLAYQNNQACASNVDLLRVYRKLAGQKKIAPNHKLERLLRIRAVRTLSGVAVISVLTKPYRCPGDCLFCPTEKNVPKSYSPNEPAVMRAILCQYDPYRQVTARLQSLNRTGHDTSKCELIVIGATFLAYPKKYQTWFIKRCFDGFNGRHYSTLAAAQKANEQAAHRCIGLSVETRPDTIDKKSIAWLRDLGATRIELGVQHLDNAVLKYNHRGHMVEQTIEATRLLKDTGFKICYHLMPGLPKSTPAKDLAFFKKTFADQDFRPDLLKIYPCVVTKYSPLYRLWKSGRYHPITTQRLTDLLIKIKQTVPRYVRISRLIRDIPAAEIMGGNKVTNLRQDVQRLMAEQNIKCRCIRCREARVQPAKLSNLKLFAQKYAASAGMEYFLTYESRDRSTLFAFLRLRLPSQTFLPELQESALIRELHTYGEVVPVGRKNKKATQHLGLGRRLMAEAEKIAAHNGFPKMAVISGIGVRGYYRKNDYHLAGTYLVKKLPLNKPILCVSGPVIIRNHKVLLIRDKKDVLWKFPGGRVKRGEAWTATAMRECREEIGLQVRLSENPIILRIKQPKRSITLVHYRAIIQSGKLHLGPDIVAARWFDIAKLPPRLAPNIKPILHAFQR